jgi:hypothetical protein
LVNIQQEEEKRDLNLFLELFGQIEQSGCYFTDVPDLLVPFDGEMLGIEHTSLYQKDPPLPSGRELRPQEELQLQLVKRAWEIFREHSNQLLSLHVNFDEPFNYQRRDLEDVAQRLAQSVLMFAAGARNGLNIIESWQAQRLSIPFPIGVRNYFYTVEHNPGFEFWGPSYGYVVPELSVQQIAARIGEKEKRIQSYRKRCDKIWLLIVTDAGMPSSHFEISDDLERQLFTTSFHRLFLLMIVHRCLIELRVEHLEDAQEPTPTH